MLRVRSSTRKTPAKAFPKGTTALLNTLFAHGTGSRGMTGLPEYRQTASAQPLGRFSHGMFANAFPAIVFERFISGSSEHRSRLDQGGGGLPKCYQTRQGLKSRF
jgi:hypothetical protein